MADKPNMNEWIRRAAGFYRAPHPSPEEPAPYVDAHAGAGMTRDPAPRPPNQIINDLIRRLAKGW